MGAALGVIFSLGLVAYEMKQARDVAMADLYQQRADMSQERFLAYFDGTEYFKAMDLYADGKKLSFRQESMLLIAYQVSFSSLDSKHYQWELGLVPDEEWIKERSGITSELQESELARKAWDNGAGYRQSFVVHVQSLATKQQDKST